MVCAIIVTTNIRLESQKIRFNWSAKKSTRKIFETVFSYSLFQVLISIMFSIVSMQDVLVNLNNGSSLFKVFERTRTRTRSTSTMKGKTAFWM